IRANAAVRTASTTAHAATQGTRQINQTPESTSGCGSTPVGYSATAAMIAALMCHTNSVSTTALSATTTDHGRSRRSQRDTAGCVTSTIPAWVAASAINATVGGSVLSPTMRMPYGPMTVSATSATSAAAVHTSAPRPPTGSLPSC